MTKREEQEQEKIGLVKKYVTEFRKSEIFKRAVSTILVSAFCGLCYFFVSWKDRFIIINGLPMVVNDVTENVKNINHRVFRIERGIAIDSAINFQYKKDLKDKVDGIDAKLDRLLSR